MSPKSTRIGTPFYSLAHLTLAYNTAVQSTTRYSPFHILFWQDVVCAIDTRFLYSAAMENLTLADATSKFEECQQIACSRTVEAQAAAKLRYDEQHRHVAYQIRGLVWLWAPTWILGLAEKLICQYIGPFHVLKQLSFVAYSVQPVNRPNDRRSRSKESAHMSRPKPYIAPSLPPPMVV